MAVDRWPSNIRTLLVAERSSSSNYYYSSSLRIRRLALL